MKRVIGLGLILMLCLSLACPAFAAESEFVPSITYKGEPEIVPVEDNGDKDKVVIGIVHEKKEGDPADEPVKEENIISYIHDGCLVITPVAEVDTSEAIPREAAETLKYVYEALTKGTMKLPYEKVEGYNGEKMVIRELLDGSWLCGTPSYDHDHPTEVEPDGIVFDVTFDLGVKPEDKVVVMTYHEDEWEPIVSVVNNGDGTVKCTFEHFCPIAISVVDGDAVVPAQSGSILPWLAVMAAALAGILVIFLKKGKKSR